MYILQPPTRILYAHNICVDINIFVSSRRVRNLRVPLDTMTRLHLSFTYASNST